MGGEPIHFGRDVRERAESTLEVVDGGKVTDEWKREEHLQRPGRVQELGVL